MLPVSIVCPGGVSTTPAIAVLAAAGALDGLGATEDAQAVLHDAIDHFPDEPRPLSELGMLLLRHRDFAAAAETFATLRERFPDNQAGYVHGVNALTQAGQPAEAAALHEAYRQRFT